MTTNQKQILWDVIEKLDSVEDKLSKELADKVSEALVKSDISIIGDLYYLFDDENYEKIEKSFSKEITELNF